MTKIRVWRYICDHCGKRSLSGGHMAKHEKSCTANPERICRFHANYEKPQVPVATLRTQLSSTLPDYGMSKLRELSDNCPMCILSAIRQSGICKWDGDPESHPPDLQFHFKDELKSAWKKINEPRAAERERYYYY